MYGSGIIFYIFIVNLLLLISDSPTYIGSDESDSQFAEMTRLPVLPLGMVNVVFLVLLFQLDQPLKVLPDNAGFLSVIVAVSTLYDVGFPLTEPPYVLYFMVYVMSVAYGVMVRLLAGIVTVCDLFASPSDHFDHEYPAFGEALRVIVAP